MEVDCTGALWFRHLVVASVADLIAPERRPPALCEPARVCPLQQKLVDRLRNPNAHTFADFSAEEAGFLVDLCVEWLDAMARLAGYEGAASLPTMLAAPSAKDLSTLLYGGEDQPAEVGRGSRKTDSLHRACRCSTIDQQHREFPAVAKDFEASIASAKAWVYIASVQLLIRRLA